MKRILTFALFLFIVSNSFTQTDGISYQAVIIGPDVLELPGVDSEGNYLPSTTVSIRFTIFDSVNEVEFQEIQTTTTDEFGRINLIIGAVEHDYFETISWDGTAKDLAVEIDFDGGYNFVDMSRDVLTFVPYAYHRNITATGTLTVDDDTFLNRELTVGGPTNLNSTLNVNDGNETILTGELTVEGETHINDSLYVNNKSGTYLSGNLTVGDAIGPPNGDEDASTLLNGSLTVVGDSEFTALTVADLTVSTSTNLTGSVSITSGEQIMINSNLTGSDKDITKYPVRIEGGNQGLAIVVNESRTNANNFISFWDNQTTTGETISGETLEYPTPTMWGRIEGETKGEFFNNADHSLSTFQLAFDGASSTFDLFDSFSSSVISITNNIAAATSSTAVIGPVPGVTLPIPSFNVSSKAEIVSSVAVKIAAVVVEAAAIANNIWYHNIKDKFQGVTYASGAGDYAEYLLRDDINEKMTYGDIVGVNGGKISKDLSDAERILVISYKPIVLGNMPQPNQEEEYEKVAFMGQVPVKVFGRVNIGDYILPSGKNDGIGVAVAPNNLTINQIKDIVGTAWSVNISGFGLINVAVGLNRNDSSPLLEKLDKKVSAQADEISYLKNQIENILVSIAKIEEGNTSRNHVTSISKSPIEKEGEDIGAYIARIEEQNLSNIEITTQDIEDAFIQAETMLKQFGHEDIAKDFFEKLKNDSVYKEKLMNELYEDAKTTLEYQKDLLKSAKTKK